jgi:ATP-dependent Clp protease adaptor protein ClpS
MAKEKLKTSDLGQEDLEAKCDLIVHNDDVNTFDFVIDTLIEVCGHDLVQAEQCTLIIHFNGKCVVKTGHYARLEPMYRQILDRGISATLK